MDDANSALQTVLQYPLRMDTAAKLLAGRYELGIYCPTCQRWGVLDLQALVDRGQGDRLISSIRTRCSVCGGPGKWQVRPPAPFADGYPRHS